MLERFRDEVFFCVTPVVDPAKVVRICYSVAVERLFPGPRRGREPSTHEQFRMCAGDFTSLGCVLSPEDMVAYIMYAAVPPDLTSVEAGIWVRQALEMTFYG